MVKNKKILLDSYFEPILLSKLHDSYSSVSCRVCGIKYLEKKNVRRQSGLHPVKLICRNGSSWDLLQPVLLQHSGTAGHRSVLTGHTDWKNKDTKRVFQLKFALEGLSVEKHCGNQCKVGDLKKTPKAGGFMDFLELRVWVIKSGQTHRLILTPSSLSGRKNSKDL